MTPGIEVDGVSKRFGSTWALRDVSFTVPAGRVVALIGHNGAGKSTLMRIVATAVLPDSGSARVAGVDVVADPAAARRRIGLVLGEDRSYFWRLSGRQNLAFFAALRGLGRAAAEHGIDAVLDAVELDHGADRRVDRYSTGMRSRLGIARALLGEPGALLLDEPTRSLDPASSAEVRKVLGQLAHRRQVAVLVATHDLSEVSKLADEVVVLAGGKVVATLGSGEAPSALQLAMDAGSPRAGDPGRPTGEPVGAQR